jgi:hypothetical protein
VFDCTVVLLKEVLACNGITNMLAPKCQFVMATQGLLVENKFCQYLEHTSAFSSTIGAFSSFLFAEMCVHAVSHQAPFSNSSS